MGWISEILMVWLGFGFFFGILLKGFRKGSRCVGWMIGRWDWLMVSDKI